MKPDPDSGLVSTPLGDFPPDAVTTWERVQQEVAHEAGSREGGESWEFRNPQRKGDMHHDSPIMLNGETHWQQDQAVSVKGAAMAPGKAHKTIARECSESEAARINAARENGTLFARYTDAEVAALAGMSRAKAARKRRGRAA